MSNCSQRSTGPCRRNRTDGVGGRVRVRGCPLRRGLHRGLEPMLAGVGRLGAGLLGWRRGAGPGAGYGGVAAVGVHAFAGIRPFPDASLACVLGRTDGAAPRRDSPRLGGNFAPSRSGHNQRPALGDDGSPVAHRRLCGVLFPGARDRLADAGASLGGNDSDPCGRRRRGPAGSLPVRYGGPGPACDWNVRQP